MSNLIPWFLTVTLTWERLCYLDSGVYFLCISVAINNPINSLFFRCRTPFLIYSIILLLLHQYVGGIVSQNAPTFLAQWMSMCDWTDSP